MSGDTASESQKRLSDYPKNDSAEISPVAFKTWRLLFVFSIINSAAAFAAVDHDLLLLRLERQSNFCATVLQLYRSCLYDKIFQVLDDGLFTTISISNYGC